MNRMAWIAVPFTVVLCAGCGSDVQQAERTGNSPPVSASATSGESAASRPRSFDVATINPCELIPASSRAALELDQPPLGPSPVGGDPDVLNCSISSTTRSSFGVFVDRTQGMSVALAGGGGTVSRSIAVEGFTVPLVVNEGSSACEAFIDTGTSTYVSVQANGLGSISNEDLCTIVEPAVRIVLDTLEKLQPS